MFISLTKKPKRSAVTRLAAATICSICLIYASTALAQINPFGRSGFELAPGDLERLGEAARPLYEQEDTPLETKNEWMNEESGNRGVVTLVQKHSYNGMPCRRLLHDIWLEKAKRTYRYIIDRCKTADGSWKIL